MASSVVTLALALVAVAAGHPDDLDSGRRLMYVGDQHIWEQPAQCSDHLSAGPADADIEMRIGGLPASTASTPVHVQWWAAHASQTTYDPLTSPVNCSVHANVVVAYPKYNDVDFNGGNVRVSEAGEAVIRIRAPATYIVWRYIAVPHIHLRLCEGASGIARSASAIMMAGVDLWISSRGRHNMQILSAGPFAGRAARSSSVSSNAPTAIALIARVVDSPNREMTTLPASTSLQPTPLESTTVQPAASLQNTQISAARDALDLKALEFSPVYRCLLEQKYFDHFSTGCSDNCPVDAAVAHGQCVRKETADPRAQVETHWHLEIECGSPCWQDADMKSSLHGTRLSIAGHLDVSFQEVEVTLSLATSSSRRLSTTKTAHLTAKVDSNRLTAAQSNTLLASYPQDAATMTTLLGLDVRTVTSGTRPAQSTNPVIAGQNDPYVPAYNDAQIDGPSTPVGSPSSLLPTEAIVGIAAGVVFFAIVGGLAAWIRRRQRRAAAAAAAQKPKAVEDKTAAPKAEEETNV